MAIRRRLVAIGMRCGLAIVMVAVAQSAKAQVPAGSYQMSCKNAKLVAAQGGMMLQASCNDFVGGSKNAQLLNAKACRGQIENINGALRCVVAQTADGIIGMTALTAPYGVETIWTIDEPNVKQARTEYKQITYRKGDVIGISAGGCVQTGGSGQTWKDYVNPLGDKANPLYMGEILIPGGTQDLEPIARVNKTKVPVQSVPTTFTAADMFVTLGYTDDKYGDNGYYKHDDGNSDQCKGVGPAWVELTILTPAVPLREASWTPGSKPFDLVWDPNNLDGNGLPINPAWYPQTLGAFAGNGALGANFHSTCGPAMPNDRTIDDTKLKAICTTQAPTMDLMEPGLINDLAGLEGFCGGDPLRGHLNWGLATDVGVLDLEGWSVGIGGDHDVNFDLAVAGNAGLTATAAGPGYDPVLHLEFNSEEVGDYVMSPWWRDFINTATAVPYDLTPNAEEVNDTARGMVQGKTAVVTGLFGIDGVHDDGQSESHPVFSMAIHTGDQKGAQSVDETWVFFIRSRGNEGNCSNLSHYWPGLGPTESVYFITLPWRAGATGVSVGASQVWTWDSPLGSGASAGETATIVGQVEMTVGQWTYLQLPNFLGSDGQVTLHYTFPATAVVEDYAVKKLPPAKRSVEKSEVDWVEIQSHISDSAVKANVEKALMLPLPAKPQPRGHAVNINSHAVVHKQEPSPASKGTLVRTRTTVDPVRQNLNTQIRNAIHPPSQIKVGPPTVQKP
jgi:hypothetical protein